MVVHADLFSGIGGFSLAAEWCGWHTAFHCENNPFSVTTLNYQFPNTPIYGDIKTTDFRPWRNKVDVLSGGFPCQPFSHAGKKKGDKDDRYLWPEYLRAIQEIRPNWVVAENVLGIVNWNRGMVFEQVCVDMENEGYEVQPYVLPACGVNAPHRRYRTFFVGRRNEIGGRIYGQGAFVDPNGDAQARSPIESESKVQLERLQERHALQLALESIDIQSEVECSRADDTCEQTVPYQPQQQGIGGEEKRQFGRSYLGVGRGYDAGKWDDFPSVPPVFVGDYGLSDRLDAISFLDWLKGSSRASGNAVVPPLVKRIFDTIDLYEKQCQK